MSPTPAAVRLAGATLTVPIAAALAISIPAHEVWVGTDSTFLVTFLAFGGVGYVVARRQPRNPVGCMLFASELFNPLRGRVQRIVDRRFNRARYDAEPTVAAFGARLRDAVDPETVLSELAAAAGNSLQPAHVSVWVKS